MRIGHAFRSYRFYIMILHLILKDWSSFVQKRRNPFQLFITQKADNDHFLSHILLKGKKKLYLHCSLNISLWKKCPTQISMFFTQSAAFLRFFAKISSRSVKLTKIKYVSHEWIQTISHWLKCLLIKQ